MSALPVMLIGGKPARYYSAEVTETRRYGCDASDVAGEEITVVHELCAVLVDCPRSGDTVVFNGVRYTIESVDLETEFPSLVATIRHARGRERQYAIRCTECGGEGMLI